MEVYLGQTTCVPVRLVDPSTGLGVTGISVSSILNSRATLVKQGGGSAPATVSITLVGSGGGQNWFETDATNCPGLYQVAVPGSKIEVEGWSQRTVNPPETTLFQQVADSFVVRPAPLVVTDILSDSTPFAGADIATITSNVLRLLGIAGNQNTVIDGQVYDVGARLTSCSIWQYDSAAHANANDHATGLIGSWTSTSTYGPSGLLSLFKIVQVS